MRSGRWSSGIRRLTDRTKNTVSLYKLIEEMRAASNARLFTREHFVAQWDKSDELLQKRAHEALTSSPSAGDHFDRRIAEADLEHLTEAAEKLRDYADQYVAHRSHKPTAAVPTYQELHQAIDDLGDVFKRYALILGPRTWMQLDPVIQGDWQAIFCVQWLPSSNLPEIATQ